MRGLDDAGCGGGEPGMVEMGGALGARYAPQPITFPMPKTRHSAMPSEPGNIRFSVRRLWPLPTHCRL